MRVATVVLGISFLVVGGVSEGSENGQGPAAHRAAYMLADGVMASPAVSPLRAGESPIAREARAPKSFGAMGFIPSQSTGSFLRSYPPFGEPRAERFNPARIPLPATRTTEDHLLTGFIAVMLIAYQLRRKHRFLRPHQFST